MTREDWIEQREQRLLNIVLNGYTCDSQEPATRFRRMCNDVKRLRDELRSIYDQDVKPPAVLGKVEQPAQPKPQPGTNGAVQPVRR